MSLPKQLGKFLQNLLSGSPATKESTINKQVWSGGITTGIKYPVGYVLHPLLSLHTLLKCIKQLMKKEGKKKRRRNNHHIFNKLVNY